MASLLQFLSCWGFFVLFCFIKRNNNYIILLLIYTALVHCLEQQRILHPQGSLLTQAHVPLDKGGRCKF